ncbi:MAG: hypothetical protein IPF99_32325 [Deltaproteobacteria bacterium]|nr:hypothetical protein [Deltaproteobacteria bacterium]
MTRAFDPDPTGVDGDAAITADIDSHRVLIEDRSGSAISRTLLTLDQPPATR